MQISHFKDVCDFRMNEGIKKYGGPSPETAWEYWIWNAIEETADLYNYLQMATEHKFDSEKERHAQTMIGYLLLFLQPVVETIGAVLMGCFKRGDPEIIQQILKEINHDERRTKEDTD